jgi:hypothetical protein
MLLLPIYPISDSELDLSDVFPPPLVYECQEKSRFVCITRGIDLDCLYLNPIDTQVAQAIIHSFDSDLSRIDLESKVGQFVTQTEIMVPGPAPGRCSKHNSQ